MSLPAIQVESVSKRYRLGETNRHSTMVDRLGAMLGAPGRVLRRRTEQRPADLEADAFWALRDVSLTVERGEVVGLIGANGAGKSTLLKLMARITLPTEGRITLNGRVGSLLEVGTGFHPELSGRENILLSGAILGMRKREVERKFDEIVAFSGVEGFIDTPVKRYSSGMYVRLAFSVAAFLEPEILLVDEVLAVGDAEFQRRCLGRMQDVVDEGRTIVFVSHNLSAIQRLCPRSVWLDRGRIAAEGSSGEVVRAYLHEAGSDQGGGVASVQPEVSRVGTGAARLTRAALIGGEGSPTDRLSLGEPIALELTFDASELIEDAVAEVGVATHEGFRAVMAQSIDSDGALLRLEPGLNTVRAELDLTLLPGEYTLDVGVHRLAGLTLDLVERVLTFSSLNTPYDNSHQYPWNVVRGAVRPRSTWSVSGDASAPTESGFPGATRPAT